MAFSGCSKRTLVRLGVILGVPVVLLGGCRLVDQIPMGPARPPEHLGRLAEFLEWKQGAVKGMGTYESGGVTYTVMLGPAGRYLASGPSAYLFDKDGKFVDWTADMGDLYTVRNGFNLTGGGVVRGAVRTDPPPTSVPAAPR